MAGTKHRAARAAVATAAALTLAGAGLMTAPVASAANNGTVLHVAVAKHRLYVDGPKSFPAGRVRIALEATQRDDGVDVIRLHRGYSWHDYVSDLKTAFSNLFAPNGDKQKGLKALNHAIRHITSYGGLYAPKNGVRNATLLLNRPSNRYVIYDDSSDLPRHPVRLTVGVPAGPQLLPATETTVIAKTNRRWGGDNVLPAKGNITFKNKSTESPHFLSLQHVKEGTTRKQVIESFSSNQQPDFVLPGSQDSDFLSYNQQMTLHLRLPAGEYAEMCFFPDPKTGEPHAIMGMVRMVHLK
jgi:hypothetical protein